MGGMQQVRSASQSATDVLMELRPDLYDDFFEGFRPMHAAIVDLAAALCPPSSSSEVAILDIASGPGEPACLLAQRYPSASVICSDYEPKMVQKAAARVSSLGLESRVSVIRLDVMNMGAIPDASQDIVTCSLMLFALADKPGALAEIHRVLKPGGHLIASVWDDAQNLRVAQATFEDAAGRPPAPMPFEVNSMGNGAADPMLKQAGGQTCNSLPAHALK